MKTTLPLILLLGLSACKREAHYRATEAPRPQVDLPKHFEAAWVMSSAWSGYMGVAIAITEDKYYYWMYSDVGGGPGDYPYCGSYSVDGGILRLGEPTSLVTGTIVKSAGLHSLYSAEWKLIKARTTTNLHAVGDKPDDNGRTLIIDVQFDPQNPFRNQDSLKPEQVADGKTPEATQPPR